MGSTDRTEGTVCNIVYETDEEEFATTATAKVTNTNYTPYLKEQKKKKRSSKSPKSSSKKNRYRGYHLSYLNLWWSRMLREADKEEKESRRKENEQERKEITRKWFQPEQNMNRDKGYKKSRRQESEDVWKSTRQHIKHFITEKSTEGRGRGGGVRELYL